MSTQLRWLDRSHDGLEIPDGCRVADVEVEVDPRLPWNTAITSVAPQTSLNEVIRVAETDFGGPEIDKVRRKLFILNNPDGRSSLSDAAKWATASSLVVSGAREVFALMGELPMIGGQFGQTVALLLATDFRVYRGASLTPAVLVEMARREAFLFHTTMSRDPRALFVFRRP